MGYLDDIKAKANAEKENQEALESIKQVVIKSFQDLTEVMNKSSELMKEKQKKKVDECIEKYIKHLRDNGFSIELNNPFGTGFTPTEIYSVSDGRDTIEAKYNSINIKLYSINYDGEWMSVCDYKNLHERFKIGFPKDIPDYTVFQDNIEVAGKRLVDYYHLDEGGKSDWIKNYTSFVDVFSLKDELQEVKKKVEININHYVEHLSKSDDIELCIYYQDEETTFNNFEDVLNKIFG